MRTVIVAEGAPGADPGPRLAALLPGSVWRVLWASHYARTRLSGAIAASPLAGLPLPSGAHESSLWLERMEK